MARFVFRRMVTVFALIAVLGTPLSSMAAPRAAAGRSEAHSAAAPESLAWLWSLLARVWAKEGCRIDPNGRCITDSQTTTDEGCSIDPYGPCLTGTQDNTDAGCMIDPYGRCIPGH
jgi:hypothetical protein